VEWVKRHHDPMTQMSSLATAKVDTSVRSIAKAVSSCQSSSMAVYGHPASAARTVEVETTAMRRVFGANPFATPTLFMRKPN
jgi:hypothetical protein